jgi:squalene-hopene/tetraprenyl-beta-curcumene cyclase
MKLMWRVCVGATLIFSAINSAPMSLRGDEPVTLENAIPPEPNRADEPYAKEFSAAKAVRFLDSASIEWQKSWGCFTCHTNISYLIARPSLAVASPAHRTVRKFAEELVSMRWEEVGTRFDAEVVATAAALAINDAKTTKKLHPLTRTSLDRMWLVQRPEGDWKWPTGCRWPPMESDDHYGVTLAAIGVGTAPDDYAKTPQAQAGLAKIRTYLKNNPPVDLHHKGMVLWASTVVDGLMTPDERKACVEEFLKAERPGGGWAFSTLYPWDRADDKPQDLETPDGYGTGFALFILRKAGVPTTEPAVQRGVAWLKKHQRASGRWFTRSLNKDNEHFISHAGSAMAVMALAECGELKLDQIATTATTNPERASADAPRRAAAGQTHGLTLESPTVKDYLAERSRRRELRLSALRKRIAEDSRDPEKKSLVAVMVEQLAELEKKPAEEMPFDASYQYAPQSNRLGFSKKVRLVENYPDGKSVILVDNAALVVAGLDTAAWSSGKFFGIESAILVVAPRPDYVFRNVPKKCFDAVLVDLGAVLNPTAKP